MTVEFLNQAATLATYESLGGDHVFVRYGHHIVRDEVPGFSGRETDRVLVEAVAVAPEHVGVARFLVEASVPTSLSDLFTIRGVPFRVIGTAPVTIEPAAGEVNTRFEPVWSWRNRLRPPTAHASDTAAAWRTLEECGLDSERAWALLDLGWSLLNDGDHGGALSVARAIDETSAAVSHVPLLEGFAFLEAEDYAAAADAFGRAADAIVSSTTTIDLVAPTSSVLATAHAFDGNHDAALEVLAAARVDYAQRGDVVRVIDCLLDEAECLRCLGRDEEAVHALDTALDHVAFAEDECVTAEVLLRSAEALAAVGWLDEAATRAAEASTFAAARGFDQVARRSIELGSWLSA